MLSRQAIDQEVKEERGKEFASGKMESSDYSSFSMDSLSEEEKGQVRRFQEFLRLKTMPDETEEYVKAARLLCGWGLEAGLDVSLIDCEDLESDPIKVEEVSDKLHVPDYPIVVMKVEGSDSKVKGAVYNCHIDVVGAEADKWRGMCGCSFLGPVPHSLLHIRLDTRQLIPGLPAL